MNRNKILLLVSIASACALAGTALVTNATLKNSDVRALTRGGSTPYQLVLGRANQTGWSGYNNTITWNLSVKTASNFDFPVAVTLTKGDSGNIQYPEGYVCNANYYDGNPFLTVTFTLKGITAPVSVVLDGTFESSPSSAPDASQVTFTNFTDNGDGTYSFSGNTSYYRHIQLATVTVNYTC